MYYFAVFTFSIPFAEARGQEVIQPLEELGLRNAVIPKDGELMSLPVGTFIGEYEYHDKDELKNMLYTEIKKIFSEKGIETTIFIAVSENAVIGIDTLWAVGDNA